MYFLYPETSGVRLEDMDLIFEDATTTLATPATQAERGSLMGLGSPVPSLDIRRGGPMNAIPGLDIDPPYVPVENGKPQVTQTEPSGNGFLGWISRMVGRGKRGDGGVKADGVQYRRLDGEDD